MRIPVFICFCLCLLISCGRDIQKIDYETAPPVHATSAVVTAAARLYAHTRSPEYETCYIYGDEQGIICSISREGKCVYGTVSPGNPVAALKTDLFQPDTAWAVVKGAGADTLFMSVDGGRVFDTVRTFPNRCRNWPVSLDVSPRTSTILCVGNDSGKVFLSTDAGKSWRTHQMTSDRKPFAGRLKVFCDPADPGVFIAQSLDSVFTFMTDESGDSWIEHRTIPAIVGLQAVHDPQTDKQGWLSLVYTERAVCRRYHLKIEELARVDTDLKIIGVEPEPAGFVFAADDRNLYISLDLALSWAWELEHIPGLQADSFFMLPPKPDDSGSHFRFFYDSRLYDAGPLPDIPERDAEQLYFRLENLNQ